ncbi:ABC transporter ATP-binding protein [Desulfococcaceae bacterium HSG9]|nr:ABC transporter ATP-binding protein [Desulfococcaceae bacterium HSG9]
MNHLFEIQTASFDYKKKSVLRDFSLTLNAGVFYGIIGPNGCGKSTLIDLMIGHQQPTAGYIHYKGKALNTYPRKMLSREIALVPQNFYINFPFTSQEVVMMGRYPHIARFAAPSDEDNRILQDIMAQTDTLAFANRFITELSGGERQRVIFARALAQDAPVLLLDEATSNLDINHTITVLNMAAERVATQQKTVIAVMQDINLAALFCDELIFMQQGSVAAHGPVKTVLNEEILRSVFQVESKVQFDPYSQAIQVIYKKK